MTSAPRLSHAQLDDVFRQARAYPVVDLAESAGVKLWRAGRRMRGECPLCHASKGKRADGAFSADPQAGLWKCWACNLGGDVVSLEHQLNGRPGERLLDAALRLAGAPPRPAGHAPGHANPVRTRTAPKPSRAADRMWREALPARGSIVRVYLEGRGIPPALVAAALPRLRFHPRALWEWNDAGGQGTYAPAMLALVETEAGPTGGVHATYLRPDGAGKARLQPAKKMWGPQVDPEGRPAGAWLIGPAGAGPLVVGEGIETSLAAAAMWGEGRPCRVAAALSLGRLQGGFLVDAYGRANPDCLQADPAQPAFTWPGIGSAAIAVDRDMAAVEFKVRAPLGGTVRRRLEGDERARICAGLAAQHWRRAGAESVTTIAPPAGLDFNDWLREGAV